MFGCTFEAGKYECEDDEADVAAHAESINMRKLIIWYSWNIIITNFNVCLWYLFCQLSTYELINIEYELKNESQYTWHRQSSATGTHVGHHPRGWCNSYEDINICSKIIQNFEFLTLFIWGLIF